MDIKIQNLKDIKAKALKALIEGHLNKRRNDYRVSCYVVAS